jgi:DNA-binding transcriptional LysR family regulator
LIWESAAVQEIDLRRLRYFARIALDGSLTRAAGVLGIAQPALSRQMHVLEESLGVRLFQRTARGMRLTEEGEYLLAATAGPLRELDLAIQTVRSAGVQGDFAVGMPPGINDAIGRDLALAVRERFPEVRLKLVEGVTGSLLDWMGRGVIDLAVVEAPSDDPRFELTPVLDTPLVLVGRGDGGDAGPAAPPVPFAAALDMPLVLPSHHLGIKQVLTTAAAAARRPLVAPYETDSARLALQLVDAGLGEAILPALMVPPAERTGRYRLRGLAGADLPYRLYLAARHAQGRAPGAIDRWIGPCIAGLIAASA